MKQLTPIPEGSKEGHASTKASKSKSKAKSQKVTKKPAVAIEVYGRQGPSVIEQPQRKPRPSETLKSIRPTNKPKTNSKPTQPQRSKKEKPSSPPTIVEKMYEDMSNKEKQDFLKLMKDRPELRFLLKPLVKI